ncbi:MAG: citrate lyase subunit beta/citryl-CoA lyase [Gammaproteobacteria bacterium]|jgi:citrate lyase subunit beta/citryl-CoA lyase
MHLVRSSLFVPGHKPDWVPKAQASGADELILDLEDAVPEEHKSAARPLVRESVQKLFQDGQYCSVRVNGYATGRTLDDLQSIVCPELRAVMLPKIENIEDIMSLDTLLSHLERSAGIPDGSIATTLALETAAAMHDACEIARAGRRVHQIMLACGPGGDAARAVGYQWTKHGEETAYLRSKAVLDSRAAGVPYPMTSSWWDIRDLDGLRLDAGRNRRLGMRGMCVMHPSHVPIVNEIFSPREEEIEHARGLLAAMVAAEAEGNAAVIYDGDMVDYAMVTTAKELIALAESVAHNK